MSPETSSSAPLLGSEGQVLRALIDHLPDHVFVKDTRSRILLNNLAHARVLGARHPDEVAGKTDFDLFPKELAGQYYADEQAVIQSGQPVMDREESFVDESGQKRWTLTTKIPLRDEAGRIVGLVGIGRNITERKRAEEALRQARNELERRVTERTAELSERNAALRQQIAERERAEQALAQERRLLRTVIDNLPDGIYAKDSEGCKTLANRADLKNLRCQTEAEAIGKSDFDMFPPDIAAKFYADDQVVVQTGQPVLNREEYFLDEAGQKHWLLTSKLPLRNEAGAVVGLVGIGRDITSLKEAEQKLEAVHRELMLASRQAGMAEVATGVLHNVGNVLNSVNVSAAVIADRLRQSKCAGIGKLSKLFQEQGADLARFLTEDERGRQVPSYLQQLAVHLDQERAELIQELEGLTQNIQHIKEIVTTQQEYARVSGLVETVALPDLVEDALKMHGGSYARHAIRIVRQYAPLPPVMVDKHKVLQILVNLFSNAKYACDAIKNTGDRQVTVRVAATGDNRARIEVTDNGVGIAPENLTRVFSQGFTTRKGGHGFGLHSGALAARELGGSLTAHSEGLGRGATFTLELPLSPPPERARAD